MNWKRTTISKEGGKYLRFEAGKTFEGVYMGYEERPNPFYDPKNPVSLEKIYDYKIEMGGLEHILSSTARTLYEQLTPLTAPCEIKIDCVQKGIKKWYIVWTMGE